MVAVVELSSGPGIGASYARAALGLIPGFAPAAGGALPDIRMVQRGVVVDPAHLAAYSRVCGFRLTGVLPATYPHVLAFPPAMRLMTAPDFPLPPIGLVHVTNRISVLRPVAADEPLDLSVRAAGLRDHPRGRQFDIEAVASVDGTEAWRGVSTYLRVARPSAAPGAAAGAAVADGAAPGGAVWRVPVRTGSDYAAVSGDRNPIHTSRIGARLFGFAHPIAHGMWTKARCLAALEGRLPDAYTVEVGFKSPLPLPATATFTTTTAGADRRFALRSDRPHLFGSITT
ncbi:MaoC/PaaZ C-terminal domain-containing protein [Actinoplanes sp. DH11]|uniref:MaoC/PaaZ C-terminal domain-containing protein n=1 Tax=Actinoplanes sp. DH11 TaxID=2857011 RepID=UPI001E3BF181|nr:MaoC/PaaZ C-terminal domain-containing protein [Actinoplanes sp. DH11]